VNPALLLDSQLCFALYTASRSMTQAYQPLLGELGLTYPQYLVMLVLWEEDGVTVKRLGERLLLDSGTLTPLLKRLETAGLLVRQRASEDERRVEVWLSPAGKALETQAAAVPQAMRCRYGAEGHETESAMLRQTLQQLTKLLQGKQDQD
jgi:DNA-binding MarR family transcriptional regulator